MPHDRVGDAAAGYYRMPAIHGERIIFVADDDLWEVALAGGVARRLTAASAPIGHPRFSPDGIWIYFISREAGDADLYRMDANGGPLDRLTYMGGVQTVAGFMPDGRPVISAGSRSPFAWGGALFEVSLDTREVTPLNMGPAQVLAHGPGGIIVIGRNTMDLATWKRYRGGTKGELWLDPDGAGEFHRLENPPGNVASPLFLGDRLFFLADHEGIGNVYSLDIHGQGLRRHTDHAEYYARNASGDGRRLVYQCGGDRYTLDPQENDPRLVAIRFQAQRREREPKIVDAGTYLTDYAPHPRGETLAVLSRGQVFRLGLFGGPTLHLSPGSGVRQRLPRWLSKDGDPEIVAVDDRSGEERLVRLGTGGAASPIVDRPLGRAVNLSVSPDGRRIALVTYRTELVLVDVESGSAEVVDQSPYGFRTAIDAWTETITGLSWSADSRYLAYAIPDSPETTQIRILDADTVSIHPVTRSPLEDLHPVFDPGGR